MDGSFYFTGSLKWTCPLCSIYILVYFSQGMYNEITATF